MAEENAVNSGDFVWQLGTAQATPRKAPAVLTLETDHTIWNSLLSTPKTLQTPGNPCLSLLSVQNLPTDSAEEAEKKPFRR